MFLIVAIKPSEAFKGCVHNNKYRTQYEELHEGKTGLISRLTRFYLRSRLVTVCAGNFADQNDRVIAALAAIALAVFTLYLWRATHGLRRYAGIQAGDMRSFLQAMRQLREATAAQERALRDQAQATTKIANTTLAQLRVLIARESPVFSWIAFKLEPVHSGIAISGIFPGAEYQAVAIVKNVGRAPLELRAFCIETIRGEFYTDFGTGPKYTDIIPVEFVVEQGREATLPSPQILQFSEEESRAFNSGQRLFWIYGMVRYYNQFTGEVWEASRIGTWRVLAGFQSIPVPGYGYHRRQEPSDNNAAT